MIADPNAALDWRCENFHFSRYFTEPAICPRSGCGSRTFVLANPADAQRDRERAKLAKPIATH